MGCKVVGRDTRSATDRVRAIYGVRPGIPSRGRQVALGFIASGVLGRACAEDPQSSLVGTLVGQMAYTIMNMIQDIMPVIMGIFAVMMGIGLVMGLFRLIVNRFS